MAIGRNANRPQDGGISDPDPILTPKIASKNFCKAVFLFL